MSKGDNVKEYLSFIREANRPLYIHEMYDVMMELKRLEKKLTLREMSDIKFLMDYDLCLKYDLEPSDVSLKYIGYEFDEEDGKIKKRVSNQEYILNDKLKTDYETRRNNIVRQVMERATMLKKLDEEKFEEMKL